MCKEIHYQCMLYCTHTSSGLQHVIKYDQHLLQGEIWETYQHVIICFCRADLPRKLWVIFTEDNWIVHLEWI